MVWGLGFRVMGPYKYLLGGLGRLGGIGLVCISGV